MEIGVLIDKGLEGCPEARWLKAVAEQVLTAQGICSAVELSLVVTNQERVRQLNLSYRGKDEPTDVLAFYMTPVAEENRADSSTFVEPPDGVLHLGEVIISLPQAVIQAEEHRHSVKREMAILIIHGVLHLLGYDHEKPEQETLMRAREKEILSSLEVD